MARQLVIVESSAKAETLGHLLGRDFLVRASLGQVKALPATGLGVDPSRGFATEYRVLPARRRLLAALKETAREAASVLLALDPDAEGEALARQLALELVPASRRGGVRRIVCHELTQAAVLAALRSPRDPDARKADAIEARRIVDRLVAHALLPHFGHELHPTAGQGRVFAAALRLLCEREQEIQAWVASERWTIRARFATAAPPGFTAVLVGAAGDDLPPLGADALEAARRGLETATFRVAAVTRRELRRRPPPPFVASSLLQEAFRALGFAPRKTLSLAERLYEGGALGLEEPVGLISFPRVDSPDAIRPTDLALEPERLASLLGPAELALYRLVFDRFVASQLAPAVCDETTVEIEACAPGQPCGPPCYLLRATSAVQLPLTRGQRLSLQDVGVEPWLGAPPERFTEIGLLRALELLRVARPSTGAALVATIDTRDCIRKEKGWLRPTKLGSAVGAWLQRHVPELVEGRQAAALEASLVAIEDGRETRAGVLEAFWRRFEPALAGARAARATASSPEPRRPSVGAAQRSAHGRCPECGGALTRREGKYGPFVSCSGFPRCRYLERNRPKAVGVSCPGCSDGQVVEREAKGSLFYGCSRYPACHFTSRDRLVPESCPECGRAYMFEKVTRREGRVVYCGDESCRFEKAGDP